MTNFSYSNPTRKIVVLRCIGPSNFFLERAIFPSELYSFDAPENSNVEIWGLESFGPQLEQRIRITSSEKFVPYAA